MKHPLKKHDTFSRAYLRVLTNLEEESGHVTALLTDVALHLGLSCGREGPLASGGSSDSSNGYSRTLT